LKFDIGEEDIVELEQYVKLYIEMNSEIDSPFNGIQFLIPYTEDREIMKLNINQHLKTIEHEAKIEPFYKGKDNYGAVVFCEGLKKTNMIAVSFTVKTVLHLFNKNFESHEVEEESGLLSV